MSKTGWDMTDHALAVAVHNAWHCHTGRELGAAIRALFPRHEAPTREAVIEFIPKSWGNNGLLVELIRNAIQQFAPPAPTRQDVPGVEEIEAALGRVLNFGSPHGLGVRVYDAARVAHAMMLELAPRERMMIGGMSVEQIAEEIRKDGRGVPNKTEHYLTILGATVARRLANTPAIPAPDPDAEAKDLCWIHENEAKPGHTRTKEQLWNHYTEAGRNGWRAVAAAKGSAMNYTIEDRNRELAWGAAEIQRLRVELAAARDAALEEAARLVELSGLGYKYKIALEIRALKGKQP